MVIAGLESSKACKIIRIKVVELLGHPGRHHVIRKMLPVVKPEDKEDAEMFMKRVHEEMDREYKKMHEQEKQMKKEVNWFQFVLSKFSLVFISHILFSWAM